MSIGSTFNGAGMHFRWECLPCEQVGIWECDPEEARRGMKAHRQTGGHKDRVLAGRVFDQMAEGARRVIS